MSEILQKKRVKLQNSTQKVHKFDTKVHKFTNKKFKILHESNLRYLQKNDLHVIMIYGIYI